MKAVLESVVHLISDYDGPSFLSKGAIESNGIPIQNNRNADPY